MLNSQKKTENKKMEKAGELTPTKEVTKNIYYYYYYYYCGGKLASTLKLVQSCWKKKNQVLKNGKEIGIIIIIIIIIVFGVSFNLI